MKLTTPHLMPPKPPQDTALLRVYLLDVLLEQGSTLAEASEEVHQLHGVSDAKLRYIANAAYDSRRMLAEVKKTADQAHRLRWWTFMSPLMFMVGALWSVVGLLIPDGLHTAGALFVGGFCIVGAWRIVHLRK